MFLGQWTKALQEVIKTCLIQEMLKASQSSSAGLQSSSAGLQSPSAGLQSPSAGLQSPSADDVSDYAVTLYATLSKEIHGTPWDTNAVQISDQLKSLDRCVVIELCKKMGIM